MPKYTFIYRGKTAHFDYPNWHQAMKDATLSFEADCDTGYWKENPYEARKWVWYKNRKEKACA